MRRFAASVLLITTFGVVATGQTPAPTGSPQKASREWRRLDAPGLTVFGNASAKDLHRTAEEILRFRLAMRELLPAIRMDPPAPTVAVVFRDDNALRPFKPRDRGKPLDTVSWR